MLPRTTHETFAQKLYQAFKNHPRFSKPKLSPSDFTICHYAGDVSTICSKVVMYWPIRCCYFDLHPLTNNCHLSGQVTYQTQYFLDKNKDYVIAEHQALLGASHCAFVAGLFPPLSDDSSKSSKFSSIGSRFKVC